MHSNLHSRYWMNHLCCQLKFFMQLSYYLLYLCSEFVFLSLWNFYLFPLIICIIRILSNVFDIIPTYWISGLTSSPTLGHDTHILKYLLSLSFLAQAEVDSHMILLDFSYSSRKCIQLTYLKIAMSKPRHSLVNQALLCAFGCLYLNNSSQNVPLLQHTWQYIWNRKISWSKSRWVNNRLVHCIFDADL